MLQYKCEDGEGCCNIDQRCMEVSNIVYCVFGIFIGLNIEFIDGDDDDDNDDGGGGGGFLVGVQVGIGVGVMIGGGLIVGFFVWFCILWR